MTLTTSDVQAFNDRADAGEKVNEPDHIADASKKVEEEAPNG